jgi:hypothetical protein
MILNQRMMYVIIGLHLTLERGILKISKVLLVAGIIGVLELHKMWKSLLIPKINQFKVP